MSLCYDSQNKLKTGAVHTLKNGPSWIQDFNLDKVLGSSLVFYTSKARILDF